MNMSLRVKKEALAQMFSFGFCEISKNTLFTEHLRTTASVCNNKKRYIIELEPSNCLQ